MSFEVTRYYLNRSPQYIMNNLATLANPINNSRPGSPITPAFILRPVSPAAAVSPITDRSTSIDEDGIPNGIDIADPVGELMIMNLPERIYNPHIPYAYQAFPIFTVNPYTLLPIPPTPLSNIENYKVPHTHNSVYHITVSTDSPPRSPRLCRAGRRQKFLLLFAADAFVKSLPGLQRSTRPTPDDTDS